MTRRLVAVVVVALVAATIVQAAGASASRLRVIGSAHASGQFAVTGASGSMHRMHVAYLRAYGRGLSGMGVVGCSRGFSIGSRSQTFTHMRSGQLYRLRLPMGGGDCDITGSLSGSGRIRLQILGA